MYSSLFESHELKTLTNILNDFAAASTKFKLNWQIAMITVGKLATTLTVTNYAKTIAKC